ncbi:MAG: glycosyltransferase family 4 protein [Candidatus Kerfeldbacteria bacterium]|nr:glycosyltransferase family 4 protein [Candidatus Kerfeldbacteria bacterium]
MKQSRHITFIIDAWYPLIGGGQEYVRQMANRLVRLYGCSVEIITRRISGEPIAYDLDPSVRLVSLGPSSSFSNVFVRAWFLCASTAYLLFHSAADVYVPQSITPGIVGKIVGWCKRRPVIMVVHGSQLTNQKAKEGIQYFIERFILTKIRYTSIISVSQSFINVPNVNKHITVIPNGVDVTVFDSVIAEKTDYPSILFVGRLDAVKGVDILLHAYQALITSGDRDSRLRIVGYGYEAARLKQLAQELGMSQRVDFLGKITGRALIALYQSSWMFALPSLSEGHPLTLLEAWAARLPVVATDVGDVGQYLIDGENGRLVPSGDAPGLSSALANLLHDSQRAKLGEQGYQLVKRQLSWERTAASTWALLQTYVQ